jgi:(p)ppGpp synthase/HD superfamily hydrolase
MGTVEEAEAFAAKMHAGQTDKAGRPYIEHPRAVASKVDGEKEKVVAWLHDTVEDTSATIDQIREMFGDEIADAVAAMTHDKNVPYMDYVRNIKKNVIARKVKMADLSHNMDLSRLANVTDEDLRRAEKYKKAYEILKD